jgi:hypothetical protein
VYQAAFDLKAALEAVRCSPDHLYVGLNLDPQRNVESDFEFGTQIKDLFLDRLEHVLQFSKIASGDDALLRHIRAEDDDVSGHESAESRVLWRGCFNFWWEATGDLKFSEEGPLHRFVETVQVALGGPPINPETLKKSAQRWKRRKLGQKVKNRAPLSPAAVSA